MLMKGTFFKKNEASELTDQVNRKLENVQPPSLLIRLLTAIFVLHNVIKRGWM